MAVSIYIPNSARGFPFLHIFAEFTGCRFFNDDHSDWCQVIPHCSFDLHFSNNEQCRASFQVCVGHLFMSSLENSLFRSSVCFSGIELCELLV